MKVKYSSYKLIDFNGKSNKKLSIPFKGKKKTQEKRRELNTMMSKSVRQLLQQEKTHEQK